MDVAIQTALIAAVVSIVTAVVGAYFSWNQIQREKTKWLTELKTSYSLELYKARLAAYSNIMEMFGKLSSEARPRLTPERSQKVGAEINAWLYSEGGLIAEASTRGALFSLRDACLAWKEGARPGEISQKRNDALFLLRRDLDIEGLESFGKADRERLLERLKQEMSSVE